LIKNFLLLLIFLLFLPCVISAQETLKSVEEEYYDFLALQGLTERPFLNYRTFSDSAWSVDSPVDPSEDADADANGNVSHIWQGQNLVIWHGLFGKFRLRAYGPDLFMSGNTAAPYGQNDGLLWQGRGFNAMLSGGVRFEGYGVELTLMPRIAFSQNVGFDYIQSAYSGPDFAGKAEKNGYYGMWGIDAPQRFGDKPFFDWDFGESEIRYTWRSLTIGFGTQPIWIGPAQLNPIIHSNNAPSYPKLDIGIRRHAIKIPRVGWHMGDIEFRAWWGYLSESNWFDNDSSNNHNLITGVSVAYSFPYFLKGLTFGLNRIMLSKWDAMNYRSIFTLLWPAMNNSAGTDEYDQRASIIIDYLLPLAGINVYLEWGRNDFSPNTDSVIRYLFHTSSFTAGAKKTFSFSSFIKGEILLEITKLECSQDYDRVVPWTSTFYAHHIIIQGHTNRGQWLGAGIGTGGNSQYLGFKLYFPKGYGGIFIQRRNPDLDYTWFIDSKRDYEQQHQAEWNIRAFLDFGISGLYYVLPNLAISSSFVLRDERNPLNQAIPDSDRSERRYNVYLSASVKYSF